MLSIGIEKLRFVVQMTERFTDSSCWCSRCGMAIGFGSLSVHEVNKRAAAKIERKRAGLPIIK
eukprot:2240314-Amphidinium_carterae.1